MDGIEEVAEAKVEEKEESSSRILSKYIPYEVKGGILDRRARAYLLSKIWSCIGKVEESNHEYDEIKISAQINTYKVLTPELQLGKWEKGEDVNPKFELIEGNDLKGIWVRFIRHKKGKGRIH
jgi:hypothetical protein